MRQWIENFFSNSEKPLNEGVMNVFVLANEESHRTKHNFIGSEQMLVGFLLENEGIAAKTLMKMGVNLANARFEIEKIIGPGKDEPDEHCPLTPRAKKMIELTQLEADELESDEIDTEHLLLALVRAGEGVGPRVLENLGIDLNHLRKHVLRAIGTKR